MRTQFDEKPGDEDGEDEERRGGAKYRCLQQQLVVAVWVMRWERRRARAATIGRKKGANERWYVALRALACYGA